MAENPSIDPAPPRRARRGARLRSAGLLVGLAVALVGCGDDGGGSGATGTTIEPQLADAASTTPDTAPPTTTAEETTTTAAPPVGAPEPQQAAATYYMAWKAGDAATAATVAEPSAVEAMATIAPGDYSLYNRCNTGEFGQSTCLYRGDAGTIQFSMADRGGSWVVTTVFFSAA